MNSLVRGLVAAAVSACLAGGAAAHTTVSAGARTASLTGDTRTLDAGSLQLRVGNDVAMAIGPRGSGVLEYPAGSGRSAVYSAGPWLSGVVNGQHRLALTYFSSEFGAGPIRPDGTPDTPTRPEHRVYKVRPWRGDPADTAHVRRSVESPADWSDTLVHHAWSEYMAGAAPYGAPWRLHRLPDTTTPDPSDSVDVPGPDGVGDQMTWSVCNDADPARHILGFGSTAPLGIEMQQTSWTFDAPGPLSHIAFMRYRLIHKGDDPIADFHVSMWSDVDLGVAHDDRTGVDRALDLGFVYQADPRDGVYGATAPAVGFQLLQGPIVGGDTLRLTAFQSHRKAVEDAGWIRPYPMVRGLQYDSTAFVDPHTGQPSAFRFDGDVLRATGWLDDDLRTDRRILLSTGPFTMSPDDTQDVVFALVVGQGTDPVNSVASLRCRAREARRAHTLGYGRAAPLPTPTLCESVSPCPRDAGFWGHECTLRTLPPGALEAIAAHVDSASGYFEFGDNPRQGLCNALVVPVPGTSARALADAAYAAARASLAATRVGTSEGEDAILLHPFFDAGCGMSPGATVAELLTPASRETTLAVVYRNTDPTHRRSYDGVDLGLSQFNGGADYGSEFLASSIDPVNDPERFRTVELVYSESGQVAHRWQRYELADGSEPPGGRVWKWAGLEFVPFTARDSVTGQLLSIGFVERLRVDASGTPLSPAQQPATADASWEPDTSRTGGHEYLLVFDIPYNDPANDALMADGVLTDGSVPLMYGVAARLRAVDDVMDPGDAIVFRHERVQMAGFDERLFALSSQNPGDPAVIAAYDSMTACLLAMTDRPESGPCGVVPSGVELVSRDVDFDRVRWTVRSIGGAGFSARLDRAVDGGGYVTVGLVDTDSAGTVVVDDAGVEPGRSYAWRLVVRNLAGQERELAVVTADVPLPTAVSPARFVPNPAVGPASVSFVLPAQAPVRLELHDLAGRRVLARDLGTLSAGRHVVPVDGAARLCAGVYFIRIEQNGRASTSRGVLLR